jgi:hypothetical protein
MDSTLQELCDLMCIRFPLNDVCIYGIRQMKIESKCIPRRQRRDWNDIERETIKKLLIQTMKCEREDHNFKYYKYLIYNRIALLLRR